jgi:hypothetical protein
MMILFVLAAAGSLASESPRAFVERLYANYAHEDYSPFVHPERVFAPGLLAAINEDSRLANGEVGYLDGDPICSCQDTGGMRSSVASVTGSRGQATARVTVSWEGTTDRRDIRLKLIRTPAGWRVADVSSPDDASLLHDLQEANRKARKH